MMKQMGGGGKGGGDNGRNGNKGGANFSKQNKDCTVWVGGIPEGVSEEEIKENFGQAGTVTRARMLKGGTASVEFGTPDEATQAISMFNGSQVGDSLLQVDAWTGK